ncbi:hypothetical protein C2G38_2235747 [Gigaspora rosea]|uniref:Uncharacterized protein n=1 Tax=Gigaspora rosea TaxID=44941 RepID=A0A397TT10_9GLOM|nr:hypothetical protein C2G38_2235747 [Gigaspora rosea]
MFDPNLPTLSPNLIYQLTQLIQQLQIVSSPSQFKTHQPPVLTSQYQNQVYWETPCPTPVIHSQYPQQQFFQAPRQYNRSRSTRIKLCFHCRRASHLILECPDVKRLGQKCNTLLKTLTKKQLEEFNEIIDENLCDPVNDKQIPKVLEFTLKLIENIIKVDNDKGTGKIVHLPSYIRVPPEEVLTITLQQERPTVTEVFDTYHIANELKETFNCAELGPVERKVAFELLQNLVAEYNDLVQELAPKEEKKVIQESLGKEVERDKKKVLEVEMDMYEDERKEEEDLPNDRIRVAEIESAGEINLVVPCCEYGVKVEKGEIKEFKAEMDKPKDEKEKASDHYPEFVDMEREEETKDPEDCYRFRIGEEDRKNENGTIVDDEDSQKKKDVKKPTEKKDLDDACESWIKKVEAFRRSNDFKETKGSTKKEYTEIEETSYASDCYQKKSK